MRSRILASGIAACTLVLLLELSARVYLFGLAGLDPRRVDSVKPLWETPFLRRSPIPGLAYEFKPNQEGFYQLVRLRTNSRGLRDDEYSLEKPASTFRVAVMGSSFTVPSGVAIEDAFHSRLEERLSAEFAPTRYEFINFAVDAHRPSQILQMLEHRALAYDPDLILVGATPGSVRLLLQRWDAPPFELRSSPVTHPVFDSFLLRLVELRRRAEPPTFPGRVPARTPHPTAIQRFGEIRARTQIPLVIVRLAISPTEPVPYEVAAERDARDVGLYYVDTRGAFRGTDAREFWIHKLNPHPNARAHARFADVVDEFLRTNGLLGRRGEGGSATSPAGRTGPRAGA